MAQTCSGLRRLVSCTLCFAAKEFFARVIQHETDHLKGIVYVDRMRDLSSLSHIAEWQRYMLGTREQSD